MAQQPEWNSPQGWGGQPAPEAWASPASGAPLGQPSASGWPGTPTGLESGVQWQGFPGQGIPGQAIPGQGDAPGYGWPTQAGSPYGQPQAVTAYPPHPGTTSGRGAGSPSGEPVIGGRPKPPVHPLVVVGIVVAVLIAGVVLLSRRDVGAKTLRGQSLPATVGAYHELYPDQRVVRGANIAYSSPDLVVSLRYDDDSRRDYAEKGMTDKIRITDGVCGRAPHGMTYCVLRGKEKGRLVAFTSRGSVPELSQFTQDLYAALA